MLPAFTIGSITIPSHSLFVFLGVVAAGAVFFSEAERRGLLSMRLIVIVGITLLCGAIGARLALVVRSWWIPTGDDPIALLIRGGKSILGGLAAAYVGVLVGKRVVGYRTKTGDLFAPAVALGIAIGRWGCFLSETPGVPTTLPWGLRLDAQQVSALPNCRWCEPGVPLHPSFMYEIVFHAVAFVTLWRIRRDERWTGHLFESYLLAYAVFRFGVEFVRGNATIAAGLSGSQLFLIPSTMLLVWYFARVFAARRRIPVSA